jgi:pyruvate kinase
MDDGRVRLRVIKVSGDGVEVAALTDAVIKSRKGVVVQNKEFDLPALTKKDLGDIRFACSVGADYIGLSYVRNADNVRVLKELLREMGCDAGVVAKIETRSAVKNVEDIARVADVILVARGDLGMNFGLEEIPRIQRRIVETSLRVGKPVVVATQLLESMVENPVPTRAEVVDTYVAVSEGVDALMLTGETAAGKYPVEAVKWLHRIVSKAEASENIRTYREGGPLKRRYAKGVAELAEDLNAKIIIYSSTGVTARHLASIRPNVPFYVAVPNMKVARSINILWGVNPIITPTKNHEEGLEEAFRKLIRMDEISIGDLIVMTYGMKGEEQVIKVRRYV